MERQRVDEQGRHYERELKRLIVSLRQLQGTYRSGESLAGELAKKARDLKSRNAFLEKQWEKERQEKDGLKMELLKVEV